MLEGPSVIRTAVIVTNHPDEVSNVVLSDLQRGVSSWKITGEYTGQERTMLYITIARSQVGELRDMVGKVDPDAFIVIGNGQTAYGEGFRRVRTG